EVLTAGSVDPRREQRARLAGSSLSTGAARVAHGERLRVKLQPAFSGGPGERAILDVFVGVTFPDGRTRFLPELADYPLPWLSEVGLEGGRRADAIEVLDTTVDPSIPTGDFEFCAALFFFGSDPTIPSNCLWSERRRLVVTGAAR